MSSPWLPLRNIFNYTNCKSVRWAIVVALAIASVVAFLIKFEAERQLQISTFTIQSESRIPVIAVSHQNAPPGAPVAFLVHGYQCNKSMMIQLAKYLALNGVNCYAIDLPGHGASTELHTEKRAQNAAQEALEYLVKRNRIQSDRLVLIGHSYGAKILGRIAIEHPSFATLVLIGPMLVQGFSLDIPRRLQILTAARDYDLIIGYAQTMMRESTAGAVDMPGSLWRDPSRYAARQWQVIANCAHVGLIFNVATFREVLSWIEFSTGFHSEKRRLPPTRITACLAALIIAVVATATLPARRGRAAVQEGPPFELRALLRPLFILGCGWLGALFFSFLLNGGYLSTRPLTWFTPLRWLRLEEGEDLAAFLFVSGVIMSGLDYALCRKAHLPRLKQIILGLPVGLAAVGTLYLIASLFISREFFHLSFTWSDPARLGKALILSVSLFPFFAVSEGIFEDFRCQGGYCAKGQILALASACLFYGLLAGSLFLVGFRLVRFTVYVFLLGMFCVSMGPLVRRANNFAAAAVFSATFSGWIIAVSFSRY